MKIYFEKDDGTLTITFTIVEESVEKNLLMLENDLPDLDTAIKIATKYAKYYGVFYPEHLKKIIHE